MSDAGRRIEALIDAAKVSIVSSVDDAGFPNTKAMLPPRRRDGLEHFYFSTNTSSIRVAQFTVEPKACLYFCDAESFRGVMLVGTMEVLHDSESRQMIWCDGDEMYYSRGVTDPDYCVLKFTAERGRYYSEFRSEDFAVA